MVVMGCVSACGTTNRDAIDAMRADFASERARLAGFVAALPPAGSVTAHAAEPFSPPLVWSDASATRGSANAAFLSLTQLADPDAPNEPQGPDVSFDSELVTCLRWTGPHNPMAGSALDAREGERLGNECRAALAVPYVVVLRPLRFVPPSASSADTYSPGLLITDVIVLAHASGAVVASAQIEAHSADVVSYTYRVGSDPVEALSRFAYSTLWSNVRSAVAAAFAAGGHRVVPS